LGVHDEPDELGAEKMLPVHQRLHDVGALAGIGLVDERELLAKGGLVALEGDPSAEEGRHEGEKSRARSSRSRWARSAGRAGVRSPASGASAWRGRSARAWRPWLLPPWPGGGGRRSRARGRE